MPLLSCILGSESFLSQGESVLAICVGTSLQTVGPTEPRTDAIVTSGEALWRLRIPVAIKRDIPFQIADDFDVIGSVRIDSNSAWVGQHRQYGGSCIEVGLAELEEPGIKIDQSCRGALMLYWYISVLIACILPTCAAQQLDTRPVRILQVTPHSSAQ